METPLSDWERNLTDEFWFVIMDEAHELKLSLIGKRHLFIKSFRSQFRSAITGTPMVANTPDIFGVTNLAVRIRTVALGSNFTVRIF